jgi:hypothetical protein
VQSAAPPTQGTYIEILHPGHLIVARVVWTNGRRFGVTTRERLNVAALLRQPTIPKRLQTVRPVLTTKSSIEPDHPQRAEQNRYRSTRLQFSFVVACGATAAVVLAAGVHQHLNRTFSAVSKTLDQM